MNKEQLIKENAVLSQNNKELGEQNKKLKDDFCKILRIYTGTNKSWNSTFQDRLDNNTISWAEVFAEVGKLKAVSDFRDFQLKLEDLSLRAVRLENKLNKDEDNKGL